MNSIKNLLNIKRNIKRQNIDKFINLFVQFKLLS